MKKVINLLSLVVLLSMEVLMPIITYAEEPEEIPTEEIIEEIEEEEIEENLEEESEEEFTEEGIEEVLEEIADLDEENLEEESELEEPDEFMEELSEETQEEKIEKKIMRVPLAMGIIASGDGWYIDGDGCLHITGAISYTGSNTPWKNYISSIRSVVTEPGASVDNCQGLFQNAGKLETVDLTYLDTSSVTNMSDMFAFDMNLRTIIWPNIDTSNVTDMSHLFYGCWALEEVDVSGFNTSNVTDMSVMFGGAKSLTTIDVSSWDTSNVTAMDAMFFGCEKVQALDVSHFNTSKVTDMYGMFENCRTLTELDVSGFDTSQVVELREMFYGCSGLKSLDVSGFDTSSVQVITWMFAGCSSLESLDLSNWDTSKLLTDDYSEGAYEFATQGLFDDCENLSELGITEDLFERTVDQVVELFPKAFNKDEMESYSQDDGSYEINGKVILEKYKVEVSTGENGTVVANSFGAFPGNIILLTVKPDDGYEFKEWKIEKDEYNEWKTCDEIEIKDNKFVMPKFSVRITAVFTEIPKPVENPRTSGYSGAGHRGGGSSSTTPETHNSADEKDSSAEPQNDEGESSGTEVKDLDNNVDEGKLIDNYFERVGGGENVDLEMVAAYEFAYENKITEKETVEAFDTDGYLRRNELAKILSQFTINVVGKLPQTRAECSNFADLNGQTDEMKGYIQTACELGLMGLESDGKTVAENFNPNQYVSRAEFGTTLSRLLYGYENNLNTEFDKENYKRYEKHLNALKEEGIMTQVEGKWITAKELRGYVLLMLMRSAK